jgi:alcohol dehydrogenase
MEFIYGKDSIQQLDTIIHRFNSKRVMIITSQSITETPILKRLSQILGSRLVGTFTESKQNTPLSSVAKASEYFNEIQADCLIGVGGGSAIDTVKGVILSKNKMLDSSRGRAEKKGKDLKIAVGQKVNTQMEKLPIVFIPTTLSGAEFTLQAGLTNDETGQKDQYYDPAILADVVIMDPEMALYTPFSLFASTGIKALDHNMERYYAKNSQPLSDAIALKAISILINNLSQYSENRKDLEVIAWLQYAAWLSQFTYGNVNVGVGHAIDHQLCAIADVPHGIASCIMLPQAMAFNLDVSQKKFQEMASYLNLNDISEESTFNEVTSLIKVLGMPTKLRETSVTKEQFPTIAERTLTDTAIVGNPKEVTKDDVLKILESAW